MTYRRNYFIATIILFIIEVLIALFVRDRFIRPYGGDVLVVILIYCFVRAFFKVGVLPAAIGVLIFAFAVEVLQYFKIVDVIGLGHSRLARIIIGTDFAWHDLLAYAGGIAIVLAAEYLFKSGVKRNQNYTSK